MSSDRTIMSLGVILIALMVATEGAPTRNFNVLIINYIRNKEIYPNMMEDIKTEMGENKAVEQIRGIARNQTKKVLNTADNNNASNTYIHYEVIEAMKNKVQKVLVEKEKLVRYEVADEIFSYFIKSFGEDINEEIEKVIDENKHRQNNETSEMVNTQGAPTRNFNVLIVNYIRVRGIYANMMEDIKTEIGVKQAVEQIRGIARNQTKKVLDAADINTASNTEIRNEVIEAMKNKVHKVLVEKEKLVRYEVADEIFSYFIKSFGEDINEEIEKVIDENKHRQINETTERINHKITTKASGSSKQSVSCALAILLISFFCL